MRGAAGGGAGRGAVYDGAGVGAAVRGPGPGLMIAANMIAPWLTTRPARKWFLCGQSHVRVFA